MWGGGSPVLLSLFVLVPVCHTRGQGGGGARSLERQTPAPCRGSRGLADQGKDKPLSAWPRGLLCCCVSVSCGNLALILLSVCRPVSRRTYLSPNQ